MNQKQRFFIIKSVYQTSDMIGKNSIHFCLKNVLWRKTRLFVPFTSTKRISKVPEIKEVKSEWNDFAEGYSKFDLGPQTFYYSLLTLMNLQNSKNILEVACGCGKLLPVAIMLKNQSTNYLAVDLAENMIQNAKHNLQKNLEKYNSKGSLENWCQNNNLTLKVGNAEEKIGQNQQKFDRIICNLVLMLTQNPQKMLQSLYDQAEQGCLLGVTVWGDKNKNPFMDALRQSITESGYQLPNSRSSFHLFRKVDKMAQKMGWTTVLRWQQNVLFPLIKFDFQNYKQLFTNLINKLPENQKQSVKIKMKQKIQHLFQTKQGLNFSCQLYLFQK